MAKKRQWRPRAVRRLVQGLAFAAFLAFVISMPALVETQLRGDWWMRLSAFSAAGASISAWQLLVAFWPAVVLLAAALLLGRYFCGWVCPLGTTFDIADRAIGLVRGTRRRARDRMEALQAEGRDFEHHGARRFKYYVLTACLVAAFVGVSVFGLFDPLSIAVRSYVLVVHSYVDAGVEALFNAFGLFEAARATRSVLMVEAEPVFQLHFFTLAVLAGLVLLGLFRRRFWCRYLCPLGAMYALAGKPAVTKRTVSDACIECGRCAEACPMSCISPDGHRTLNGECVLCLNCQPVCPTSAVSFFDATPREQADEIDLTRRGALTAVAAGAAAYPLYAIKPANALAKEDPLIRPPLAGRDIDAFLEKCLRCGQCMRACPTHVIQPSGLAAGIEGLWTPKLEPRLGYCIYECEACGKACPSGAIPNFTLPEKHSTAMGLAYLDRVRCIPWRGLQRRGEENWSADDHNCGVCEEVCPVPGKAIHFRYEYVGPDGETVGTGRRRPPAEIGPDVEELRLPYIRDKFCVGCGFCEASCPVVGDAAVRVTGGFRELPEPPEAAPEAVVKTEDALPVESGNLRLAGPKETYSGAGELWDYINGEGDRYLPFGFVRVSVATYTDGENRLQADLWRFEDAAGAYGAYAKDRQGEPVDLGEPADETSMLNGSLWARKGSYAIRIIDLGETPPESVKQLARQALLALDAESAPRPEICRRLPRQDLNRQSVIYMRDEAPLWDVELATEFIPDGTFAIQEGAEGAYGAYALREDELTAGLLLIEYAGEDEAAATAERLAGLREQWGHEKVEDEPFDVYRAGEGNFSVVGTSGPYFAAAWFMPSADRGAALVRQALP